MCIWQNSMVKILRRQCKLVLSYWHSQTFCNLLHMNRKGMRFMLLASNSIISQPKQHLNNSDTMHQIPYNLSFTISHQYLLIAPLPEKLSPLFFYRLSIRAINYRSSK